MTKVMESSRAYNELEVVNIRLVKEYMPQVLIPKLNSFPDLYPDQHLGVGLSSIFTDLACYKLRPVSSYQRSSSLLFFN